MVLYQSCTTYDPLWTKIDRAWPLKLTYDKRWLKCISPLPTLNQTLHDHLMDLYQTCISLKTYTNYL